MENFFCSNRKKLSDFLQDRCAVVLFAGQAPLKRGDERYPFSPDRNFYYFTGISEQNIIYMAFKVDGEFSEMMFLERFDPVEAKWTGAVIGKDEAKRKSGIEDFKYIDEFYDFFSDTVFKKKIEKVYLDLENRYMKGVTPAFDFAEKLQKNYPYINIANCYNDFAKMRMIKESFEINKIKQAIDITKEGILLMMQNSKSGMFKYEIEAYFDFVVKKRGASDFAFKSIAASGVNATILHYSENNCKTKKNELILFDVGAQVDFYNGDITRTFPVDGKFTDRQKVIYDIVLRGQKKIIESIKPNIPFISLNNILKEFYLVELKKIGLLSDDATIDDVSKYYYHSVSHLLGLETHDAGRHNEGILEQGMVMTVEPGLYIEDEGIGIRIEDNVVVTENGCEVLSKDIIKEISDIENYMAKRKSE